MDKPDFEMIAKAYTWPKTKTEYSYTRMAHAVEYGCNHVWSSHVEPLQKENEKLKELQQVNYQLKRDIDDQNLKIERQADHIRVLGSERSELTYNIDVYKDELKTLQSEITQLRNEIRELKDEMRVQSEIHDPE